MYLAWLSRVTWTWRQLLEINFHVAGNEEIQTPVAIVVSPGCSGAPSFSRYTKLLCYIRECSVAVVVIQTRNSKIRDVQIGPTIIVVITDCHTKSPAFIRNTSRFSYIFKLPVAQIVEESRSWRFLASFHCRDR